MLLSLSVAIAAGYAVVVAAMYVFQRSLVYLPSTSRPVPSSSGVPEMVPVPVTTADGLTLQAWYRHAQSGAPTLVYYHGNGGHIGYRGPRVRPYLDAGLGVLLVEYRGYGGNPGRPSEEGLYADAQAALDFLAGSGTPAECTVLYGESLGSTVAVRVAAEQAQAGRRVAAVVLEAPLSSVADVGQHHYPFVPVRWLIRERFEAHARVADVGAPVFVAHGDADRIVPIRYGRKLFDAASQPKEAWWVAGGGHEDLPEHGLPAAVIGFLDRHVGIPCRGTGGQANEALPQLTRTP